MCSLVKPSTPGLLFAGRFFVLYFVWFYFTFIDWSVHVICFFWFSFDSLYVSRKLYISSRCKTVIYFFFFLYFCVKSYFSSLSFIYFICVLSLFLVKLVRGLLSFWKSSSWLIDFFFLLIFISIIIISSLILIIFFLLLTSGFVCCSFKLL